MAITYGYFNSLNGDRTYSADQMSEYFKGLVSDGVYESVGGALQVLASQDPSLSGMAVAVQTGRALIDCRWLENDAVYSVVLRPSQSLDRYTAVIVRLDYTNRLMTITTKDGTPAPSPTMPEMTNTESIKEICLAQIHVPAGTPTISQSNITDMRASSQCGWVTGLIEQVDTSQLFLQWQTAYEEFYQNFQDWFDTLTSELTVGAYVTRFNKVVTGGADVSATIQLDMDNYTYEASDIVDVYINGLRGIESTDYTLDVSANPPEISVNATMTDTNNAVEIVVTKSKLGNPLNSNLSYVSLAGASTLESIGGTVS